MPQILPGTVLTRELVIGARLVAILQSEVIVEDDMEWGYTYFRLDNGAVFGLPFDDAGSFLAEHSSSECSPQHNAELQQVLGKRIVDVLREPLDSDVCHDFPYLIMDNGYVITNVLGYPVGPGHTGLHIYAPGEVDAASLIDFFP